MIISFALSLSKGKYAQSDVLMRLVEDLIVYSNHAYTPAKHQFSQCDSVLLTSTELPSRVTMWLCGAVCHAILATAE